MLDSVPSRPRLESSQKPQKDQEVGTRNSREDFELDVGCREGIARLTNFMMKVSFKSICTV